MRSLMVACRWSEWICMPSWRRTRHSRGMRTWRWDRASFATSCATRWLGKRTMRKSFLTTLAYGVSIFIAAGAHAATTERFSILANGETVGHVVAVQSGQAVDVDYAVSDNGRGPKHKEHLVLNAAGIPVEWSIEGTSLMGGAVSEHLTWKNGVESWVSQADKGEVNTPSPRLYIGNDASPWALGLYTHILLKTPGGALDVLPGGRLRLEKLRVVSISDGPRKVQVQAY